MPKSNPTSDYKGTLFSHGSFVVAVMPCWRRGDEEEPLRGSILYSLLHRGPPRWRTQLETAGAHRRLRSCVSAGKLVTTRAPLLMFAAASQVLAKTLRFLKSVACFRALPTADQLLLLRHSWAPLLVVGLVQDSVRFDTVETPRPSLLHAILTRRRDDTPAGTEEPGVPMGVAERIQMFLGRCSGLRMSGKEFALVRGAILFTPELKELECRDYIQELHREALRALNEHVRGVCGDQAGRLGRLLALLHLLRSVDPQAVAGLFFRPVTGSSNVVEHMIATFDQQ